MIVAAAVIYDITSVGASYRVYPKASDYPHISIALSDIIGAAQLGTYAFQAFHWSREKVSARVTFTEPQPGQWVCDQDGKYQLPQRKIDVKAAKIRAQAFLTDCGAPNTWAWTTET